MIYFKHYFFTIFFLYYAGCRLFFYQDIGQNRNVLHQVPEWYQSQDIRNNAKIFEIIGFGDGVSFEEARMKARNDIAKQIKIMHKSNFSIDEKLKSNDKEQDYSLRLHKNITEQTSVELDDIIQIKSEYRDNHLYVALKYIHLPTAQKIKYKLYLSGEYNCNNKNESKYLSKTTLMKNLKKIIGCEPNFEIVYKNSNWYINIEQILTLIPSYEFINLWAGYSDHAIKVKSTKNLLKKGETFHLKIDAYKQGYLSLFDIYHTGQTVLLLKNQKIHKRTHLIYPDINKYEGLEADIPQNHIDSKDLYISILCSGKKDLSRYEPIDNKHLASKHSFYFGYLLEDMKGCNVASEIVHIRP